MINLETLEIYGGEQSIQAATERGELLQALTADQVEAMLPMTTDERQRALHPPLPPPVEVIDSEPEYQARVAAAEAALAAAQAEPHV